MNHINQNIIKLDLGQLYPLRILSLANEKRNYKIFEEFPFVLIEETRQSCYKSDFEINVEGNVNAFDSTTIDLCLVAIIGNKLKVDPSIYEILQIFEHIPTR